MMITDYDQIFETLATDDYEHGYTTIEVPVLFLIQNIVSSCDYDRMNTSDDWLFMMKDKAADSGFGWLVESILERGFLPSGPIGICRSGGYNDYNDGDYGPGLDITEGHHRLTAAILLGMDTVFISSEGKNTSINGERLSAHYQPDGKPIHIEV